MSSLALARVYQKSFSSHPYGTLAVTNGCLNALGDIVAQAAQNVVSLLFYLIPQHSSFLECRLILEANMTTDLLLTLYALYVSLHLDLEWVS